MTISHTFNLIPVPQIRPRAARTRLGVRLYDPKKVSQFKKLVAMEAKLTYRQKLLEGPLRIDLAFYRPIQNSLSNQQKRLREAQQILPAVKPDLDNYVKSFLDALHGIYWIDDNQICEIHAKKYYGAKPRIEIEVSEINE
jgi:Holliday junction resolvase RusA-like endonuclease